MRSRPSRVGAALHEVLADSSPGTPLAAVQAAWPEAAGEAVAAQAQPVAERSGTVTVACRSATWAQELDLMQEGIRERLNAALEEAGSAVKVGALRFSADATRHGMM